jgi:hypothetical protein
MPLNHLRTRDARDLEWNISGLRRHRALTPAYRSPRRCIRLQETKCRSSSSNLPLGRWKKAKSDHFQAHEYHAAIDLLRKHGARIVHPVYITPPEKCLVEDGTDVNDLMNDIIRSQIRAGCEYYLSTLDNPAVTDLAGIIEINEANADEEFDEGPVT